MNHHPRAALVGAALTLFLATTTLADEARPSTDKPRPPAAPSSPAAKAKPADQPKAAGASKTRRDDDRDRDRRDDDHRGEKRHDRD